MDIDGECAFDKVLDRLIDTAADLRLGQEKMQDERHQLHQAQQAIETLKKDLSAERVVKQRRIYQLEAALTKARVAIPDIATEEADIPF